MDNLFTLDVHEVFMSRALELARQGMGKVSPNPMVGCILVKDGEIIGEGYHEELEFFGDRIEIAGNMNFGIYASAAFTDEEAEKIFEKSNFKKF